MNTRVCLRAGGVALLVVSEGGRLPRVVHWGADFGALTDVDATTLALADRWSVAPNSPDEGLVLGVLPEARYGWTGTPGLIGSRDGADWSPAWSLVSASVDGVALDIGTCRDD